MEKLTSVGKENLEKNMRAIIWKGSLAWERKILRKIYGP